ncbi:MAG: hypothetical protein ACK442_02750 [Novosphingobium sp.]|jgi:hypothetical protein|nr:hypothetical protein [Brevundimonas sp.]MCZ8322454.1 hypothetical protein [Novosphingobium sp.]
MKRSYRLTALALMAAVATTPAVAGWKLVPAQAPTAVAKGKLTVTPDSAWNRWSVRPIKKGEIWTLDGTQLNEVYFVTGLIPGETLYRDAKKKDNPLPQFRAGMQLTDLPDFFESSNRVVLNTSLFKITAVEPYRLGGHDGVKFSYEYGVDGSALIRKGIAAATVVGGQLHLISYTAPALHYFERDRAKAEALMASAKF